MLPCWLWPPGCGTGSQRLQDDGLKSQQPQPRQALPSRIAIASPTAWHRPPRSRARQANAQGQLTREQIDALLEKLREPSLARKFLMDAGLIDAHGQLTRPYRSQDTQTA